MVDQTEDSQVPSTGPLQDGHLLQADAKITPGGTEEGRSRSGESGAEKDERGQAPQGTIP